MLPQHEYSHWGYTGESANGHFIQSMKQTKPERGFSAASSCFSCGIQTFFWLIFQPSSCVQLCNCYSLMEAGVCVCELNLNLRSLLSLSWKQTELSRPKQKYVGHLCTFFLWQELEGSSANQSPPPPRKSLAPEKVEWGCHKSAFFISAYPFTLSLLHNHMNF